ncbi:MULTISPECIES: PTS cellobiose transporter subunit IIA [Enterococcus]|uniref:PTS system cellobiose-specific IIA componenent n=1 Tax=Enterococcus sulfureus ATCC 49903 TaxID=1140003 RepID=S0NXL1_9ENTE|nr:PTS cellobiose transporter subunit IIA [Enterococcus sulfureus]EOT46599.1 PTS system cellobiose-specific IIA componenent [Enterococcus sulfureus ATCC 49903]EOT86089.1 PTS system cellobiose-specific IIA componenent [Enterococcus sulfureus ATCC 49903]
MSEQMTSEEIQVVAFTIILHSGNARTNIHQAFKAMREGDFEQSAAKLEEAKEEVVKAHNSQTDLLHAYAGGTKIDMEIIMVHAQDHLMTTMTLQEVAEEMSYLYQQNQQILKKIAN